MRNGRIEQDAPPDELYENPASIFVARFVGTPPMNVVPLQALTAAGGEIAAPPGLDPAGLSVGIRPEVSELGESGIAAEVVAVEYLGADTLVEARIGGHPFIVRRPGKVRAAAGDRIYIRLSQSLLHWFDQSTERRVVPG
jgi:sn-glycerol 3-phosphate transport system ATP-binding protein